MPIRRPDHGCHGYSSSQNSVPWAFSSLVVQHDQAPRLNRIQATSTRGVRARIRRVAGCAPPTGSAGHAGATANLKLTFHLDHSAGADQLVDQEIIELLSTFDRSNKPTRSCATACPSITRWASIFRWDFRFPLTGFLLLLERPLRRQTRPASPTAFEVWHDADEGF